MTDADDNCPNDANRVRLDTDKDRVVDACTEEEEPEDAAGDKSDPCSEETSIDVDVNSSSNVAPDSTPDPKAGHDRHERPDLGRWMVRILVRYGR